MACRSTSDSRPLPRPKMRQWLGLLPIGVLTLIVSGCAPQVPAAAPAPAPVAYTPPPPPPPPPPEHHETIVARASWYGPGFEGHKTATGERFSSAKMTAAAKGIPLGSRVVVTNLSNGRSATVRINDCGPYRKDRKLDLSKKAARQIGIVHDGTAKVKVEVVKKPPDAPVCPPSI